MTPREIELLTIAKLEHDGHQLSPAELRELKRKLAEGPVIARRYREMMTGPTYRWSKPAPRKVIGTKPAPDKPRAGGSLLTFTINSGF
ncbi:hypothetical protein GZZ44_10690 [Klebsiella aerogenes]|uniref:hypothetical protein n=1 Tax=Klebsiella aerogenes TaxID=548 RepID=UPI00190E672D|nr:hypothetical protein [Klebsiella aerogenes]MBK0633413.1 hypothetical protein [Klebsiella aerogenes]MDS1903412.1 hypothetical protein [Klebsiella aerogenes]MDS1931125.1 hypothetical protein [Klebsiella aerogenes]MDS2020830.1 hypothetical protein [Klebsiella aerogenes]MDY0865871.1 hypothetical protein [Klebsiella aerogenes]